jgi:hypothetical protein
MSRGGNSVDAGLFAVHGTASRLMRPRLGTVRQGPRQGADWVAPTRNVRIDASRLWRRKEGSESVVLADQVKERNGKKGGRRYRGREGRLVNGNQANVVKWMQKLRPTNPRPKGLLAFNTVTSNLFSEKSRSLRFVAPIKFQFPTLVNQAVPWWSSKSLALCPVCRNRSTRQRASIGRCEGVVSRENRGWRGRGRVCQRCEGKASRRSERVKCREKRRRGGK